MLACGGVEFDVMLSADGTPVLIHDETLDRTTDGQGLVAETPDNLLFALDAGSWFHPRFAGQRIPSLQDAAQRCRALGLAANLEIKPSAGTDVPTAERAVRDAKGLWADSPDSLLLSSFSEAALERAAALAPEFRRGLLVEAVPADWSLRCARLGASALHVDHRELTHGLVSDVRAAGLWVVAYTVNTHERAGELVGWGVDCVITDRPDLVRKAHR